MKLSPDIDTYILYSQQGKYIVKYFKSPDAIVRMSRTKRLLTAIKSVRPDFPCIVPEMLYETAGESIYIEEYADGILMGKADFSEANMMAVCSYIVGYMRDLRELGCFGYAPDGFSWRRFLSGFAERRFSAVMELGLLGASVFREFFAYVCECVKDINKMIWYFRRHKKFGDCFIDMYSEAVCVPDMRTVKLYFALDILNHFSEYRKLITQEGWNLYFKQELEIIKTIWRDDFNLW